MRLKNAKMIIGIVLLIQNCVVPLLTCSPEEKNNRISDRYPPGMSNSNHVQYFYVVFDSCSIHVCQQLVVP